MFYALSGTLVLLYVHFFKRKNKRKGEREKEDLVVSSFIENTCKMTHIINNLYFELIQKRISKLSVIISLHIYM
jgi:hypothetical protein